MYKVVFANTSIFESINIKNIIPEEYRPVTVSRNFISDYSNGVATIFITPDGNIQTLGNRTTNYVGSFCYFTL